MWFTLKFYDKCFTLVRLEGDTLVDGENGCEKQHYR